MDAVSVAQRPHHIDLFDQALPSLRLGVGKLLREGLDRIQLPCLGFMGEVDRRKIAGAYLLLGDELLMEPSLAYLFFEDRPPFLKIAGRVQNIGVFFTQPAQGD